MAEEVKEEIRTKTNIWGTPEKDAAGEPVKEVISKEDKSSKKDDDK